MTNTTTNDKKSRGRSYLPLFALSLLAVSGFLLRPDSSELKGRAKRVVATEKMIQGQPIDSKPTPSVLPKRALPEEANLEELSRSAPPPSAKPNHLSLTLDRLSEYEYPVNMDGTPGRLSDGSKPQIPAEIRKLDQERVTLSGYMMPLDLRQTRATYFLLLKNQLMCCYGQEPQINEYAIVVMKNPASVVLDKPVTVSGVLSVGETFEKDVLLCLYKISGETVDIVEP